MLIFTYGSNMNANRLRKRVPSAIKVTNAYLQAYKFICNKVSKKDGSAKANVTLSETNVVWGVLYEIDDHEKEALDIAEGLGSGYDETNLLFLDSDNNTHHAQIYIASLNSVNDNLKPYDWYKDFILSGATENDLPSGYIEGLRSIEFIVDPDEERRTENYRILRGE